MPITLEAAILELRDRGPEVIAARAAERQASAALLTQREGYLPDVILGFAWSSYDSEFFPSFLQRTGLSLTFSWPIWDAGRRELGISRARAERDVARADREDRERGSAEVMARAYNGYRTATAGLELSRVGLVVSTENYRVQRARYQEGATSILDLLEAQSALTEAEAALVQSRYQARLALASIEALLGRRLFDERN